MVRKKRSTHLALVMKMALTYRGRMEQGRGLREKVRKRRKNRSRY